MTAQSGLQRGQQIHALLAQGRQVASDATKGYCSRLAAEGARDLLLHFDHAHIPLHLVIVKRHDEAVQEGQHRLLIADQAVQQVARRTLFGASFGAGRSLSSGVVAVEGLDLRGVEPGRYELICLPIRLEGSDGAPARAVLVGSRPGETAR